MHLTQPIEFEQKQVYNPMFSTPHNKISTVYEHSRSNYDNFRKSS